MNFIVNKWIPILSYFMKTQKVIFLDIENNRNFIYSK